MCPYTDMGESGKRNALDSRIPRLCFRGPMGPNIFKKPRMRHIKMLAVVVPAAM